MRRRGRDRRSRCVDVGIDQAGPHGVDADALGRKFLGQADRERVDGAFGGGVVGGLVGAAELGRHRRHVDDDAAFAAEPRRHAPHRFLRGDERADGIDGDMRCSRSRRDVDELASRADDAGVVEEGVEAPSSASTVLNSRAMSSGLPTSAWMASALRPSLRMSATTASAARFVAGVVDRDVIAALGRQPRRGGADAAAGAGDEHDFGHWDCSPKRDKLCTL